MVGQVEDQAQMNQDTIGNPRTYVLILQQDDLVDATDLVEETTCFRAISRGYEHKPSVF